MADPRHALGLAAERAAATWLMAHGWTAVAHRVRSRVGGEIDLVMLDPTGTLVAVEVRARRTSRTGAAATTVDERRVRRLARTLASFGVGCGLRHSALRIDLVAAEPLGGGHWRLRRLPGIG